MDMFKEFMVYAANHGKTLNLEEDNFAPFKKVAMLMAQYHGVIV